jgi:hypothetical protein
MAAVGIQHWFMACFATNFTCSELDFVLSVTGILGPFPAPVNQTDAVGLPQAEAQHIAVAQSTEQSNSTSAASSVQFEVFAEEGTHAVDSRVSASFGRQFAEALDEAIDAAAVASNAASGWNATDEVARSLKHEMTIIRTPDSEYVSDGSTVDIPFSIHGSRVMPPPGFHSVRVCVVQMIFSANNYSACLTPPISSLPVVTVVSDAQAFGRLTMALKLEYTLWNGTSPSPRKTSYSPPFFLTFGSVSFGLGADLLGPDDAIYTSSIVDVVIDFPEQMLLPPSAARLILTLSNAAGWPCYPPSAHDVFPDLAL